MADGQSKDGKQLLFALTLVVLGYTAIYYHNQNKLTKIKLKEAQKGNLTAVLSN